MSLLEILESLSRPGTKQYLTSV